jgi:hypothetical protein
MVAACLACHVVHANGNAARIHAMCFWTIRDHKISRAREIATFEGLAVVVAKC